MKDFYDIVIGNATIGQWGGAMFFALLMQVGMLLLRAKTRDKLSERTPYSWSWSFFWCDTSKQIIGTVILIFIFIRVLQFIIAPKYLVAVAVAVGLCADLLVLFALRIKDKIKKNTEDKIDNFKP